MEIKKEFQNFKSSKKPDKGLILKSLTYNNKPLPYDERMEQAVLGSLLLEKEAIGLVKEWLKDESIFFSEKHKTIFWGIQQLNERSESVDVVSLIRFLRENNKIENAGGRQYLAELVTKINSISNLEYHVRVIVELATKRKIIEESSNIIRNAYDETADVFNLLNEAENNFFKISELNIKKNYLDSKSILKNTIDELELKKQNNIEGVTGISSGFTDLDAVTGGWQNSELTIIAARPGMGKTAFVLSTLSNAAIRANTPVAIFSLEMSAIQLMLRLISSETELESDKLRKGNLENHEWQQLRKKIEPLSKAPIFIDDTPALSILELRAKCRRLKAQHDIKMVVIDYLQLMSGDEGTGQSGNREQEIAAISRSLKNLAKELDVPVIALSQLSRAVEIRGGEKIPQLSDLRESGSIEQDADLVMFLYRPEYYKMETMPDGSPSKNMAQLIIAKNRGGTLSTINLKFIGQYTKFSNLGDTKIEESTSNYLSASSFNKLNSISDFEGINSNPEDLNF